MTPTNEETLIARHWLELKDEWNAVVDFEVPKSPADDILPRGIQQFPGTHETKMRCLL